MSENSELKPPGAEPWGATLTPGKRKRGGQAGNVNAIRTGKYAVVFWGKTCKTAEECQVLAEAHEIPADDLRGEIALLRSRLWELLKRQPEAVEVLMKACAVLAYLARTQYHLSDRQADQLLDGMINVLAEFKATTDAVSRGDFGGLITEEGT